MPKSVVGNAASVAVKRHITNASTRTNLRGTSSVLKKPSTEDVPLRLAGYASVMPFE